MAEFHHQGVGHQAGDPAISTFKGMDFAHPVVESNRNFVGRVGILLNPALGLGDHVLHPGRYRPCRHPPGRFGAPVPAGMVPGLVAGPKLLLLDEPSAGLAPVIVQSIMQMVKRICAEGYTVLIVEQNIRQVLKVVDRAYLLETGRIKSSGSSAALLASDEIRKAYLGI